MEETIVKFKTSVLVKEKGFDNIDCNAYYHINNGYTKGYNLCYSNINKQEDIGILAPTQSLLQKYLRDVHNINIQLIKVDSFWTDKNLKIPHFQTYEDALEEALLEGLKLI